MDNCSGASGRTILGALLVASQSALSAQQQVPGSTPTLLLRATELSAGTPAENSMLAISLLLPTAIQTGMRPLSIRERDTLVALARQMGFAIEPQSSRRLQWSAPVATLWINTGIATTGRDGAVWQGRGVTAAATGGLLFHQGMFSAALRPVAFRTQNLAFTPAIRPPPGDFRNPFLTGRIDVPYRFGDRAYTRLDPGESWARFDAASVGAGFSTAAQSWGPSRYYPLAMSTEAGGYPRVFLETTSLPLGIGRLKAQWSMGRLESSGFDGRAVGDRSRMLPAFVASFAPAVFPGLSLGATRLFHVRWRARDVGLSAATLPFVGLLKSSNPTKETTIKDYNQLASVFARLAPPGSGLEAYGEFYRDDHSADSRDLAAETDHSSAYTLGLRHVARKRSAGIRAVTLEAVNSRITHLARVREEGPLYTHGIISEGHTYRGQTLGSSAVPGGGGVVAAVEWIDIATTTTFEGEVRRTGQNMEGGSWNGRQTGFYEVRIVRAKRRGLGVFGWSAGLQQGFGFEKATSFSVRLFANPQ